MLQHVYQHRQQDDAAAQQALACDLFAKQGVDRMRPANTP
jgi:hypothetical protein